MKIQIVIATPPDADASVTKAAHQAALVLQTIIERSKQYNKGGVNLEDYWIYGAKSILHELNKKVKRAVSQDNSGQKITDAQDIVAYGLFLMSYLEDK